MKLGAPGALAHMAPDFGSILRGRRVRRLFEIMPPGRTGCVTPPIPFSAGKLQVQFDRVSRIVVMRGRIFSSEALPSLRGEYSTKGLCRDHCVKPRRPASSFHFTFGIYKV